MMRVLQRKLLRDLFALKGQALAIALVVAAGVATFIMAFVTLDALRLTQASVYHSQLFADVFAEVKRAPEMVAAQLRELPGVAAVDTRVQAPVHIRLDDSKEMVVGLALSIPDGRQPGLNRLFLRAGTLPAANRHDQLLVNEAFAKAHALVPGQRIGLVINGHFQRFQVSGIVLSPEFIYLIRPGELFPDFSRYGVVWLNRSALAASMDMQGAFNSVTLALAPGQGARPVMTAVDAMLARWGSLGAYDRDQQLSHRYLSQELTQLAVMAGFIPIIFIGVAAFLLNMVTARLIQTQRTQIAVLKAFGYGNTDVALHYLQLVLVIVLFGAVAGVLFGLWLASGLGDLYREFFHFPWLEFRLQPALAVVAVLTACIFTMVGTVAAVHSAYRLPPAAAMRPPAPAHYARSLLDRSSLGQRLSAPSRMIWRNLSRRPVKALLSMAGIAFAMGILMLTGFQQGTIDYMLNVQFRLAQQQDLTVVFTEPLAARALQELRAMPGIQAVEGFRSVPVMLRHGPREYRTALQGYEPGSQLSHVLDDRLSPIPLPEQGLMLTDHLAGLLKVQAGDVLEVHVREGRRPILALPVAGLVTEYVGVGAYMQRAALGSFLREGPVVSGAFLAVVPGEGARLQHRLEALPYVAAVTWREYSVQAFRKLMAESIQTFTMFNLVLAGIITMAVVYNNARIAFAERRHELATLRVLGLTRAEIAFILLGELLLLTLLALPLGFLVGAGLAWLLTQGMQTDLYRVPLVLTSSTFAYAAVVVLASTLLASLFIANNLHRLDMVAALKAAE